MNLEQALSDHIASAIETLYGSNPQPVKLERTNPDFAGDYTFVVFPLLRLSKSTPEATANAIGESLKENAYRERFQRGKRVLEHRAQHTDLCRFPKG